MRSNPGPGGTLVAEIDGFGVSSALTVLTNSTGGARLKLELFYADWVLERFAGLWNPPAVPERLSEYEGSYVNRGVWQGEWEETVLSLRGSDGALRGQREGGG